MISLLRAIGFDLEDPWVTGTAQRALVAEAQKDRRAPSMILHITGQIARKRLGFPPEAAHITGNLFVSDSTHNLHRYFGTAAQPATPVASGHLRASKLDNAVDPLGNSTGRHNLTNCDQDTMARRTDPGTQTAFHKGPPTPVQVAQGQTCANKRRQTRALSTLRAKMPANHRPHSLRPDKLRTAGTLAQPGELSGGRETLRRRLDLFGNTSGDGNIPGRQPKVCEQHQVSAKGATQTPSKRTLHAFFGQSGPSRPIASATQDLPDLNDTYDTWQQRRRVRPRALTFDNVFADDSISAQCDDLASGERGYRQAATMPPPRGFS